MVYFNEYMNAIDFSELTHFFRERGIVKKLTKKDYFARQGESSEHVALIKSGIFKYIRTDNAGISHVVGYSFPGEYVCDYTAVVNGNGSTATIQSVTDCEIYLITSKDLEEYWSTNMETQRLGRIVAQQMFVEMYKRLMSFYCDTPQQRYTTLIARCPQVTEYITLKEIASFIGVTPETVSHIRKKLLK